MIFYRFWSVEGDRLVSPFAGVVLPPDGLVVAHCEHPHTPPGPGCRCGISVYANREDAEAAARLMDGDVAITEGKAIGAVLPEVHMQPYQDGARWITAPMGKRARAYQVTRIYTDEQLTTDSGVPVAPLEWLNDAR